MEGSDAARLGRILASAESPARGTGSRADRCGLCDARFAHDEAVVEVAMSENGDGDHDGAPDAWLCGDCYEYVVEELGIAPTSVFKAGDRRTVVLPLAGPNGDGPSTEAE